MQEATVWSKIKEKLTFANIVVSFLGLIGTAIMTGAAQPTLSWFTDTAAAVRDDWSCQGRAAENEGDRLSGLTEEHLAAKEMADAKLLFARAITQYEKAYACGFPDAGIRLAVLHCTGMGTPKNALKARQYVLEIEAAHPTRSGRTKDVRGLCRM